MHPEVKLPLLGITAIEVDLHGSEPEGKPDEDGVEVKRLSSMQRRSKRLDGAMQTTGFGEEVLGTLGEYLRTCNAFPRLVAFCRGWRILSGMLAPAFVAAVGHGI